MFESNTTARSAAEAVLAAGVALPDPVQRALDTANTMQSYHQQHAARLEALANTLPTQGTDAAQHRQAALLTAAENGHDYPDNTEMREHLAEAATAGYEHTALRRATEAAALQLHHAVRHHADDLIGSMQPKFNTALASFTELVTAMPAAVFDPRSQDRMRNSDDVQATAAALGHGEQWIQAQQHLQTMSVCHAVRNHLTAAGHRARTNGADTYESMRNPKAVVITAGMPTEAVSYHAELIRRGAQLWLPTVAEQEAAAEQAREARRTNEAANPANHQQRVERGRQQHWQSVVEHARAGGDAA